MWLTSVLQNAILLNCFQSLLTHVSRATKNTLNKLGVFTVSSFHAFICARSPSLLNNLLAGRGATKRRPPMLSRSNSGSSRRSLQMTSREESEKTVKVSLPDNQVLEDKIARSSLESSARNCRIQCWSITIILTTVRQNLFLLYWMYAVVEYFSVRSSKDVDLFEY